MRVRVLRIVEYVGEEADVARQVERSISGTCCVNGKVQITVATLPAGFDGHQHADHDGYDECCCQVGKAVSLLDDARKIGSGPGEHRLMLEYNAGGSDAPNCVECGGDLGGMRIGRIESHRRGCSRFPL